MARRGFSSTRGPSLVVPFLDVEPGTPVLVQIRADDILLARGPISGLSAQNLIEGIVERIVPHGSEAEVLIRTGERGLDRQHRLPRHRPAFTLSRVLEFI